MALEDFFEDFIMLDRVSHTDTLAGIYYTWEDGAPFRAGCTTDQSTQARIAYQNGAKVLYTLVIPIGMPLKIDDRVKRKADGQIMRVTSDPSDMHTPNNAKLKYQQASAEAVKQ